MKPIGVRQFWAYASAFGAMWGAIEVTLGVFLHTLRVPMSGVLLASVGAAVGISARALVRRRGITLAVGLVAAICRASIPIGGLFGPCVGIMTEAALVELLLLPGCNMLTAAVAGGVAALWPPVQFCLVAVLLYGGTLTGSVVEAARRLDRSVGEGASLMGILPLLVPFTFLGAAVAVLALRSLRTVLEGRGAELLWPKVEPGEHAAGQLHKRESIPGKHESGIMLCESWAGTTGPRETDDSANGNGQPVAGSEFVHPRPAAASPARSAFPLPGVVLFLLLGLAVGLQAVDSLLVATVGVALWVAALLATNPRVLRLLGKPRYWVVGSVVMVLAGLLLAPPETRLLGIPCSVAGMEAGLRSVYRATLLATGITWLAQRIDRTRLRPLLCRLGLDRLERALAGALQMLPRMVELTGQVTRRLAPGRGRIRRFLQAYPILLTQVVTEAELGDGGQCDTNEVTRPPLVVALLGPPNSGKSTACRLLAERLKERGIRVAGILQVKIIENGTVTGWDVEDLATGERLPLVRRPLSGQTGWAFSTRAFEWAGERIVESCRDAHVLMVDEVGHLEAQGRGHMPALLAALRSQRPGIFVLAVRGDREKEILQALGYPAARVGAREIAANGVALRRLVLAIGTMIERMPRPLAPRLRS